MAVTFSSITEKWYYHFLIKEEWFVHSAAPRRMIKVALPFKWGLWLDCQNQEIISQNILTLKPDLYFNIISKADAI